MGHKGQKARSGVAIKGFEGGQMPIHMRLPKRGFTNIFRQPYSVVRLDLIKKAIDAKKLKASSKITREALVASGLLNKKSKKVKLLANLTDKKFSDKITIEVHAASKTAHEIVEKAGGSISLIAEKKEQANTEKKSVAKKTTKKT